MAQNMHSLKFVYKIEIDISKFNPKCSCSPRLSYVINDEWGNGDAYYAFLAHSRVCILLWHIFRTYFFLTLVFGHSPNRVFGQVHECFETMREDMCVTVNHF